MRCEDGGLERGRGREAVDGFADADLGEVDLRLHLEGDEAGVPFEKIEAAGGDPDLVLGKGRYRKLPRFAHHSWRRLADTTAEECLAAGLCSVEDIELHFGWRLRELKKQMRLHYSDRGKRTARAKVVKGM